jgi:hypothetical protein
MAKGGNGMIIPKYWAEARLRDRVRGHQLTLRRFGWSDASQEDAQASAEIRVKEALAWQGDGEFGLKASLRQLS